MLVELGLVRFFHSSQAPSCLL